MMIKWFGDSLRSKLSVIMLITTLIPLLFLGTFAFVISSNITEEKAQQAGLDTLAQMDAKFRFILRDVENMSLFLIGQSEVQAYMNKPDETAKIKILGLMTNLVYSKDYISNITIYSNNPNASGPLSTSTIYQTNFQQEIDITQITDKTWTNLYHIENYLGDRRVFSFIRPFRSYNNYQTLGWLSITLDEQVLSRIWSEPKLAEGHGQVALLNTRNEVMSATDKSWLDLPVESIFPGVSGNIQSKTSGEWTHGQGKDKHNLLYYREPSIGWTLLGAIPSQLYSAQNRYILQLSGIAVVLAVLTNVVLTLFVIQRVTNPLRVLTRLLSKINPNEPLPHYAAESRDEIGRLAQSYNMLGTHIEELKEQLIHEETRKKEADMRALQAQINPHFLYNTLSSIHWIALMAEEESIAEMVGALSDFLRFSLNKGKEYCTVSQEIAHIRNYVLVQSIRFPDEFEVAYTVDAALNNTYMLKLLLQPLVENAMIHGIQKKEVKGNIAIYVEQKGAKIHFKVMDDGIGMTEEQLNAVRASLNPQKGLPAADSSYGMRNVHERLQLHYGPESGLTVESKWQAGTCVSFAIPILEESHENHDR